MFVFTVVDDAGWKFPGCQPLGSPSSGTGKRSTNALALADDPVRNFTGCLQVPAYHTPALVKNSTLTINQNSA